MTRIIFQDKNFNIEKNKKETTISGFVSDRELLKKRSKKYMELIASIDTKMMTETVGLENFINNVQEELGTANIAELPIGIVAKCFLGHPHEVHTLDMNANYIIKHYKIGEPLPEHLEKARNLAKHNSYAFIEVYLEKMILIREDGTANKL